MLPVAVLLLAISSGSVDVVVSRSVDTTPERADDLLQRVSQALAQTGLKVRDPAESRRLLQQAGVSDPRTCAARRGCLKDLGVSLDSQVLVGLDVGHVTGQMVVNLDAVRPSDGQRVAQHGFTLDSSGYPAGLDEPLRVFAQQVRRAVPDAPAADAPVAANLQPASAAPAPVLAASAPVSHRGPMVLGGVAAVAALGAAIVLSVAAATAAQLPRAETTYLGQPASTLTRSQAEQLASLANAEYAAAAVTGGVALVLGTGALVWGSQ